MGERIVDEKASDLKLFKVYKLSRRQFAAVANGECEWVMVAHGGVRPLRHLRLVDVREVRTITMACLHDYPNLLVFPNTNRALAACPTCELIEAHVAKRLKKRQEVANGSE